jgi:aminocarboxymuconate-semialdehyde decarboxylase
MIIDIYTHIFPGDFYRRMTEIAPKLENLGKRMRAVTKLHDLDERFAEMDGFGEYRQVISLPNPPLEDITTPEQGAELARVANDAMAELVTRHPDRFAGFAAAIPMHNMDAAMVELHRVMDDLGARGVQIFTNIKGRALDDPDFAPVFDAMAEYDQPIWLHPVRTADVSDYAAEPKSRFELWWTFGWPYDTSVAMTRLVFAGLFDKHPDIKIITHHLGGMIPYFEGRVDGGLQVLGARTTDEDYSNVLSSLKKPHGEYFKMFYGDTAMFGAHIGIRCGIEYYGADHVVFASDAPVGGPTVNAFRAIDRLELDEAVRNKICFENAARLMNTTFE